MFRAFTPDRRPSSMVQHGPSFCVTVPKARSGPAMVVIFEEGLLRAAIRWSVK
jgi:hypothetical protein